MKNRVCLIAGMLNLAAALATLSLYPRTESQYFQKIPKEGAARNDPDYMRDFAQIDQKFYPLTHRTYVRTQEWFGDADNPTLHEWIELTDDVERGLRRQGIRLCPLTVRFGLIPFLLGSLFFCGLGIVRK